MGCNLVCNIVVVDDDDDDVVVVVVVVVCVLSECVCVCACVREPYYVTELCGHLAVRMAGRPPRFHLTKAHP